MLPALCRQVDNLVLHRVAAYIAAAAAPRPREPVLRDDSSAVAEAERGIRVFRAESERLEVGRRLRNPVHGIYRRVTCQYSKSCHT